MYFIYLNLIDLSHKNIHTKYTRQELVKFTTHKSSLQESLEDVFQQIEKRVW